MQRAATLTGGEGVMLLAYSLGRLSLKIINGPRRLFLMEEREENELCHLFMGDLETEQERETAGEHYQAKLCSGSSNQCQCVLARRPC